MKDLEKLDNDWPSPFVARTEIEKFTQGKYKPSSMKRFDTKNEGINRKIKFKSKIAYLKEDVINWLKGKLKK